MVEIDRVAHKSIYIVSVLMWTLLHYAIQYTAGRSSEKHIAELIFFLLFNKLF